MNKLENSPLNVTAPSSQSADTKLAQEVIGLTQIAVFKFFVENDSCIHTITSLRKTLSEFCESFLKDKFGITLNSQETTAPIQAKTRGSSEGSPSEPLLGSPFSQVVDSAVQLCLEACHTNTFSTDNFSKVLIEYANVQHDVIDAQMIWLRTGTEFLFSINEPITKLEKSVNEFVKVYIEFVRQCPEEYHATEVLTPILRDMHPGLIKHILEPLYKAGAVNLSTIMNNWATIPGHRGKDEQRDQVIGLMLSHNSANK